jgi:hypothetical protein
LNTYRLLSWTPTAGIYRSAGFGCVTALPQRMYSASWQSVFLCIAVKIGWLYRANLIVMAVTTPHIALKIKTKIGVSVPKARPNIPLLAMCGNTTRS